MSRRFFAVLHLLGVTVTLFACAMLLPVAVSVATNDGALPVFEDSFLIAFGLGVLFWLLGRWRRGELRPRDGFMLVSVVWVSLPALAAIPLYLYFLRAGTPITVAHAYFEAMSGLTTTGATALTGLDSLPMSINLWRTTLVWLGGMGILVLAVAVLPLLGVGGHQVFRAEVPGPIKDEKLTPRIAETAKALYAIYVSISLVCFVCYRFAGLSWFDSWTHMSSTMGLGGFSTYDDGFMHFDSPAVEAVAMVFMLIAGINFATHFQAFRFRSFRPYRRCPEAIPYLATLLSLCVLVSAYLYWHYPHDGVLDALRKGFFNTISVGTTTGFANTDYALWPILLPLTMLLAGSFCTSAGSTGGGIKMIRVVLLFKQARQEMRSLLHPHAVMPVRVAGRIVPQRLMISILAFMLLYVLSMGVFSALMLMSGLDALTALTAVFAMINNIGPGLGAVGPMGNYAGMTDFQAWICTFAMLIGRLELFTVLVLFLPDFWRR
ncbi:TrkH family potassium uptake protein [Kerstersia similis]|uniref:TrkH family potassium uptake protein n=1 Tax=Kerstersia similis TaxID=206505 RepID=UPI0039F0D061